jgi:hypothetical protein
VELAQLCNAKLVAQAFIVKRRSILLTVTKMTE